jgi:mannose-6-phosphate isomerase-like protein (cupin superfamily)
MEIEDKTLNPAANPNRAESEAYTPGYYLKDKTNAEAYTWGETCRSYIIIDKPELSVKQEFMPPGTKERLHVHENATQVFHITEGAAVFYIADKRVVVSRDQSIVIEPGQKHLIANESSGTLTFVITSQPSTKQDRVDLEI